MPGQPWALAALLATIAVHLDVGWAQAAATTAPDCVYAGKEFIMSSSAEDLSGLCTTDLPTSLSVAFTLRLDSSDLLVFKAELLSDTFYYLTAWVDTTLASLVWEVDLDGWQQVEVPLVAGETHRYLATFSAAGHMQIFKNGNLEGELASGLAMPAGAYGLTSGGGGVGLIKDLSIFHEVVAWASAEVAADTATSSTTTTDVASTTTLTSTSTLSTSSTSASSTTSSSSRTTSSSSRTSTETTTSSGSTTTSSTSSTASSTSSSTWTSTSTGTSTRTSVTRSSTTTASTTSTLSTSGTTLTSSSTSSESTTTSRTGSSTSATTTVSTFAASTSATVTFSTTSGTRSTSTSRASSSSTPAESSTTTGTRTTVATSLTHASSSSTEPAPPALRTSVGTTASTAVLTSASMSSTETPAASLASSTAALASPQTSPRGSEAAQSSAAAEPAEAAEPAAHFTSPAPAEEPGAAESTTSTLTWVMSAQSEQEEVLAQGKEVVPQGNGSVTTTMPGLSTADQVAALQRAADEAARLLRGQLRSNETSISMELPGGAVASVTRLNFGSEAGNATSFTVAAPGSATQVILPKALVAGTLAAIDEPVFLEAVSSSSALGDVGRPVLATVSLSLKLFAGGGIKVDGLPAPVQFTVPVNYTRGLTCVFWDESLEDWSSAGVSNGDQNGPGKPFSCATRHFTLFGVIFQGFVETLSCAKFTLFTSEGLAQLSQGDWYKEPSVLIYWCSLGGMLLLMAWAAFLDRWRNLGKHWTPESLFLLPQESERETVNVGLDLANAAAATPTTPTTPPARRAPVVTINSKPEVLAHEVWSSDEEPADELKTEASYAKRSSSKTPGRVFDDEGKLEGQALTARNTRTSMSSTMMTQNMDSCAALAKSTGQSLGVKGLLMTVGTFCMENTVRDACDEIFSDWFEWFSELRGSAEEVCSEIDLDWMGMVAASHFAMSRLVVMSSARVTAASLGLSWDLVVCVLEEEDVRKVLAQRHYFRTRAGQDPGPPSLPWCDCLEREDVWSRLHADICESVTRNVSKRLCWALPLRIFANYLVENPIGRICAVDLFMSSKMRALLFLMEFLGAMMVVSLFFANSGNMKGRPKAGGHMATCGDASLQDEITYKLGRAWAVAVGSVILSGIPVSLLSSLRTVSFKTFEEEWGIPWQQQLRRWQIQGCMVWLFGTLYVLFAAFFCALFLANLSEDDLKEWTTTLLMSIAWDLVLVPLVKVTIMSSLAESLVVANAWHAGVPRGRMVGHVQQHLFLRTNIRLPIMSV